MHCTEIQCYSYVFPQVTREWSNNTCVPCENPRGPHAVTLRFACKYSRRCTRAVPLLQGCMFPRVYCFPEFIVSQPTYPQGCVFPRTHTPNALSSTSHSEICFPGYFVSPPPLRKFSYNTTG